MTMTMRCHRQGQAFSAWRDGQTEPQARKRTGYRKPHSAVTPYTCETEIPFGRQMSGGSDNAMSSARASVSGMAWWPNGMEVRKGERFGEKA